MEFPKKAIGSITSSKTIIALLVNKAVNAVTQEDIDRVLTDSIFDYQYVDMTTQESAAYIWVEIDIPRVANRTVKDVRLYVTVSCHKKFMRPDKRKFPGMTGNRRDNLVRFIDKVLNFSDIFGIGKLKLQSVKTLSPVNGFTLKELEYLVPDFNLRELEGG